MLKCVTCDNVFVAGCEIPCEVQEMTWKVTPVGPEPFITNHMSEEVITKDQSKTVIIICNVETAIGMCDENCDKIGGTPSHIADQEFKQNRA